MGTILALEHFVSSSQHGPGKAEHAADTINLCLLLFPNPPSSFHPSINFQLGFVGVCQGSTSPCSSAGSGLFTCMFGPDIIYSLRDWLGLAWLSPWELHVEFLTCGFCLRGKSLLFCADLTVQTILPLAEHHRVLPLVLDPSPVCLDQTLYIVCVIGLAFAMGASCGAFDLRLLSQGQQLKRSHGFLLHMLAFSNTYLVSTDCLQLLPFFVLAEMELAKGKGSFRRKQGNEDYRRQKQVVDIVRNSDAWKRSGGKDHVFVLTDPVAMWHFKAEVAPAILLVVDFGGWYRLDSKSSNGSSPDMIQHTQVSLLKDVIVPYTHLLPRLQLSENKKRSTLLYFKGAKHRHRGGIVREKLWELLVNEPGVVIEEGFPNATGREQSIRGMRSSEFCLHPAGDTPSSCRLFDAIQSLCIPVVVSDNIELPFEGMVDYTEFTVFVAVDDALKPRLLVDRLRSISVKQRNEFRRNMAKVQPIFQYDNGHPGGIGPISPDGAVNHIWKKVLQKLPAIKEAVVREKRKPPGVSVPMRCHCT
uniref:Exostosin GT47 domain-containing protein n=1 Tax=Salix viminalis TaxID=40686 RepID=A0A6N2LSA6_SALVM